MFACNSPNLIEENDCEDVCELLLFAASYLSVPPNPTSSVYMDWPYVFPPHNLDPHSQASTIRMLASGMKWLRSNFPKVAFNPRLEKFIASTAQPALNGA
jgi:hypothetical protein